MIQHSPFRVFALLVASTLATRLAFADFAEQAKLVGADAVGRAYQGTSVAISADGNTAIVGGFLDYSWRGAAWVWTRSGTQWSQQGTKLAGTGGVGNTGVRQGDSVAISADGNTALVGGAGDNNDVGAVWAWTRSGGVWNQQGTKLVASDAVGASGQGGRVALSADGNTALVGGGGDNGGMGAAWVWTRSGGVWSQQGPKLVGSGAAGNAGQGAVALSADGNTAIIGGSGDDGGAGAVWIWTRNGGTWTQQGTKLVSTGAVGKAGQGGSVSISGDGNTAIVGGPQDNSSLNATPGAVWFWVKSGGAWNQQGPKLVGSGASGGHSRQGLSVSISGDGNTAISGGPGDSPLWAPDIGATWVWRRTGSVWQQQGDKLVGENAGSSEQGNAVAISADGSTAIVGGWMANAFVGAAWVFAAPDELGVTISPTGDPLFLAGGNVTYRITLVNAGPGSASGVVVTDVLPAGTTLVSATPSRGVCSGSTTLSCWFGYLGSWTETIDVVLKMPLLPGTVSNTATVTASFPDANPGNDSATSTITTIAPSSIPTLSEWVSTLLVCFLLLLGTIRIHALR